MKPPRVYTRGLLLSSAESAEAPAFAKATAGPTVAFIHGHTPMVFCEADKCSLQLNPMTEQLSAGNRK